MKETSGGVKIFSDFWDFYHDFNREESDFVKFHYCRGIFYTNFNIVLENEYLCGIHILKVLDIFFFVRFILPRNSNIFKFIYSFLKLLEK